MVQQTYENLQTEVEAQREIINTLRSKYKHHDREVKDLNREHHEEKQDLINEIRSQGDELKFCKKVMALMLRPDEVARIRSKAAYSEELDDWSVPAFIFKQKDLVFPKLNGMSLVNDQLDQRQVHILD